MDAATLIGVCPEGVDPWPPANGEGRPPVGYDHVVDPSGRAREDGPALGGEGGDGAVEDAEVSEGREVSVVRRAKRRASDGLDAEDASGWAWAPPRLVAAAEGTACEADADGVDGPA